MSYTWDQFKVLVGSHYNVSAQLANRESAAIEAVALFVKGAIVREVDADLPLAKSYRDAYLSAKVKLAGYTITSNFATVKASVVTRLTVDGARTGISEAAGYNDIQIQQGIDDFNGTVAVYDNMVVAAVVELQRHIPIYRHNHQTEYLFDDAALYHDGMISRLTLPAGSSVNQVFFGEAYDDLVANTAYAEDDYVRSNGRVYQCVTAGTSANPLGDGLTVTADGETEYSGTAKFEFIRPSGRDAIPPIAWQNRQVMYQTESAVTGPIFTINQQGSELWLWPALRQEYALTLDYDGLKSVFAGADATPFDVPAAQYVAEYVRAMLQKNVAEDDRAAGSAFTVAQGLLKRLWMDSNSRS